MTDKARRKRRHALILPREHGAWGLLLVPLATGAGVAFREVWAPHVSPPLRDVGITVSDITITHFLLLLVAALALFWLRTPVESLMGTSAMRAQTNPERRPVAIVIAGLAAVAALALGALLWAGRNPDLWLIGAAAAAAFIAQALLRRLWRQPPRLFRPDESRRPLRSGWVHRLRMLSEIVGTIGLTSSAPAAYYVITGRFGPTAWTLWLANLIVAGNQIHYVQLRIHTVRAEGLRAKFAHGWAFALGQVVMAAALALLCLRGLMPWLALISFGPLLFRGWLYFFQKPTPLAVRHLGWNELGHGIAFCVLFIAAFVLNR